MDETRYKGLYITILKALSKLEDQVVHFLTKFCSKISWYDIYVPQIQHTFKHMYRRSSSQTEITAN